MAERRMFSKKITDTDAFLSMPMSTQCLYFHLAMHADDEGFVGNPLTIQRSLGASQDDLKILLAKRFLLGFESGVVVIKHWKIHNYIQSDRFNPTTYLEEKSILMTDEKNSYTECIQNVYKLDTQDSIDKNRLVKDSIDKNSRENTHRFVKPTVEEISAYCEERKNNVNAQRFFDFYESKGWRVGNQPMKDWKACVRTWEQRDKQATKVVGAVEIERHDYTDEQLDGLFTELGD